jgi:predicted transcriptional regulator
MESKNQSSDDFGTFLQSVQHATNPGEANKSTSSMKIMSALSKVGEVEVTQLMVVVEMSWTEFRQSIDSLASAGLVNMDETGQGSRVQLTSEGKHWANALASPADDEVV